MSDDNLRHQHKIGEDIGFEREDLSSRSILAFLIALALIAVLIHFVLTGIYGYMDAREKQNQPPQNPLNTKPAADVRLITPADVTRFPQPRLESDERTEINGFRTEEEKRLNSYGWVDQNAGVVHIPIDRAMQLIAQRGLPTRPAPEPPAKGNLSGQASAPGQPAAQLPSSPAKASTQPESTPHR
jgi:hypothetical protein